MTRIIATMLLVACSSGKALDGRPNTPQGGGTVTGTTDPARPPTVSLTASQEYTNGVVTLTATVENGDNVQLLLGETVLSAQSQFDWDTRGQPEGSYQVIARGSGGGGTADSAPVSITVDRTPPKLVRSLPKSGSTQAFASLAALAQFDEVITAGELRLVRADGSTAAVNTRLQGDTLSLDRATLWGPTSVRLQITNVTDRAGNASSLEVSAQVPATSTLGSPEATDALAFAANDSAAFVAFEKNGVLNLKKITFADETETALGDVGSGFAPALAVGKDGPIIAFVAGGKVHTRRHDGSSWQTLDAVSGDLPRLATKPDGEVVLAVRSGGGISVSGAPAINLAINDFDFAYGSDAAYVAAVGGDGKLSVWKLVGGAWSQLGAAAQLQAEADASVEHPRLAVAGAAPVVVWSEASAIQVEGFPLGKRNIFAARFADGWQRLGHAIELRPKEDASLPLVGIDPTGRVYVTFREADTQRLASFDGDWRFLGGGYAPIEAFRVDALGPLLLGADSRVHRVNLDPSSPPKGLTERPAAHDCDVPETIADGTSIAATRCYADVSSRAPVAGAVPYDIIAPLWTDGAEKRRFFVLPAGQKLGYKSWRAWTVPNGTVLAKEFYWNGKPMETRLLVKRDETRWTGYSFRWNTQGTDATLVGPSGVRGSYDGHTHIFPSRTECLQCHNTDVGGTIGLWTAQLNRSVDYGGVAANQLDTLFALGVVDRQAGPDAPKLAAYEDTSESYEFRSRSYFQGNCTNCHYQYHNGTGEVPKWGPWYYPLSQTNLCDHNHIDEGSVYTSVIYRRDQNYERAGRMPPIGTLVTDPTNEVLLRKWIEGMQPGDCPPWDLTYYPIFRDE